MRQLLSSSSSFYAAALGVVLAVAASACNDNTLPAQPSSSSSSGSSGKSSSSSSGSSGALLPTSVRIANFNARNLFNDVDDSDTIAEETIETTADYQKHLRDVAGVLAQLAADVVVLVEVENKAVLDDLIARDEIAGKYAYTEVLPGNDPRGINIGIVSSVPIESTKTHRSEPIQGELGTYRYSRDVPEYHLRKDGHAFTLLGIHFKAKAAGDVERDNDKRLAEARGARALADALLADDANGAVMLLGDFNDDTGSPSVRAIQGDDPEYEHALGDRPESDRWTVEYGGVKMTYDDQWASPGLASKRSAESVTLLRVPSAISDHAAVAASYELGE